MKRLWKWYFESPTHVLLPVGLSLSERCYNWSQKILQIKGTARLLLGGLLNSPCYKQSQAPLKSGLPYLCKLLDLQNPFKALCKPNYHIDCWNQGLLHADNWKYTITKEIFHCAFMHWRDLVVWPQNPRSTAPQNQSIYFSTLNIYNWQILFKSFASSINQLSRKKDWCLKATSNSWKKTIEI